MPGPVPMLFYAAWPLGYHNPEAQRKAIAFARAGYRVTYVPGMGLRNPRPTSARKLLDRGLRKLRHAGGTRAAEHANLHTAALVVAPPRQLGAMRRLNRRWVGRQLRGAVPELERSVAWLRWPTPELVDALADVPPLALVYERVDAYEHSPGVRGRWAEVYDAAERALVARADAVVVTGEVLADRIRALGKEPAIVPHGVEPFPWRAPDRERPPTIGFAGTLDYRLDMRVLRHVAERHPEWRLRLIGPVQEGFDPGALAGLPNVSIESAVANERLGEEIAGFAAGIMPYSDHPACAYLTPVKTLELMAAGRPAVARPIQSLRPFGELLYFADTPQEFVAQLELALSQDDTERARARRAVAERNTWDGRMVELQAILQDALDRKGLQHAGRSDT